MELSKAQKKTMYKALRESQKKLYPPWEPIKEGFLTAKEFASLFEISGKRLRSRLMRDLLAAQNHQDASFLAPKLVGSFRGGVVHVHVCQGKGATHLECRVAIDDLAEEYQERAKVVLISRYLDFKRRKMLELISRKDNVDMLTAFRGVLIEQFKTVPLIDLLSLLAKRKRSNRCDYINVLIEKKIQEVMASEASMDDSPRDHVPANIR